MMNFETHGHLFHGKGSTKHPNERKYKVLPHKKRMYLPIWELCFRWRFDQGFWSSKEFFEVLVTAVFIWPKLIADEIVAM